MVVRTLLGWVYCSLLAVAVANAPAPLFAAPAVPGDDDAVLERLPRTLIGERAELRAERARLDREPGNLPLALRIAERYVALGRVESDPRFYGYAGGIMQPWFGDERPPPNVRVMRATLAQYRHDFAGASADLKAAIADDPRNARAWLTLATVERVQGRYADASDACSRLFRLAPLLVTFTCLADVGTLHGQAKENYARLRSIYQDSADVDSQIRIWTLTVLAESAARASDPAAADLHFREALGMSPRDPALLAAYGDFLFDQQRPADVRALLQKEARSDPLLLRLAVAERLLGNPVWMEIRQVLAEHIASARRRGDRIHLREEARFALSLADDPATAINLASENWRVQREPADARLVLEAALAANAPAAADPVLRWLIETNLEDAHLIGLARQIGDTPAHDTG